VQRRRQVGYTAIWRTQDQGLVGALQPLVERKSVSRQMSRRDPVCHLVRSTSSAEHTIDKPGVKVRAQARE